MDNGLEITKNELKTASRFIQASLTLLMAMGVDSIEASICNGCIDILGCGIKKANVWSLELVAPVHLTSDNYGRSHSEYSLVDILKGGFRTYIAFGNRIFLAFTANNFTQSTSKQHCTELHKSSVMLGKIGIESELAITIFKQAAWSLPVKCELNGHVVNTLAGCRLTGLINKRQQQSIIAADELDFADKYMKGKTGEFLILNGVCVGNTQGDESPLINFCFSDNPFCSTALAALNSPID